MEVTLPPPSSSSLEYQFPESPKKEGQRCLGVNSGVHYLFNPKYINVFVLCFCFLLHIITVKYAIKLTKDYTKKKYN